MIPARRFLGLKHVVTMKHLENMNKIMLVTGMFVTYGYVMEHFIAWYSGDPYEFAQFFYTRYARPDEGRLLDDDLLQRRRAADLLVRSGGAPASR